MYLWEYWRQTRRGVYIYLGFLALFAVVWAIGVERSTRLPNDPAMLWGMVVGVTFAMTWLCALVMAFALGNNNVGSDIHRGTADFLLTRPRSRQYFVWIGWAGGMAELFALLILSALALLAGAVSRIGPVWRQLPSATAFEAQGQVMDVPLMAASVVLTAAVIFGLTYFLTILLRSGLRGVIASLAIVLGYSITSGLLRQLAGISLPSMHFARYSGSGVPWYLAPTVELVGWTILALLFPVASQIVLLCGDV
jgi:ABC-type transport system involved in multi-copper enzyme maturation permease subunit